MLIAGLFFLGFFREFVFENINSHLIHLKNQDGISNLPGPLFIFKGWSFSALYYTKFLLVLLFAAGFFGLTHWAVSIYFRTSAYWKATAALFLGVFLLSLSAFVLGKLTGFPEKGYSTARFLIEFIQSPLALFLLIPGLTLLKEEKN